MQVFEAGKPLKCNPLAYWEFRDCWDYVAAKKLEYHPLHDQVVLLCCCCCAFAMEAPGPFKLKVSQQFVTG